MKGEKMAKYKVGDTFIGSISEVDSSGLGTVYLINGSFALSEKQLDGLEFYTPVEEKTPKKAAKSTHTLDDLEKRVWILSKLLSETIEKRDALQKEINGAVESVDVVIEQMKGE